MMDFLNAIDIMKASPVTTSNALLTRYMNNCNPDDFYFRLVTDDEIYYSESKQARMEWRVSQSKTFKATGPTKTILGLLLLYLCAFWDSKDITHIGYLQI